MTPTRRFIRPATIFAVFALGVAACAKKDAAPDTTAAVTPAPAAMAAALNVVDIDMGRHIGPDNKITDKTDDFAPTDTIYASVQTSGAATAKTMMAKWTFGPGTVVDSTSTTISPTGDAYTEFHIAKPSGFPKGTYTVHVMLDGAEVRTKDVTVK